MRDKNTILRASTKLGLPAGKTKTGHNPCSSPVSMIVMWSLLLRWKRQEDRNKKYGLELELQRHEKITILCVVVDSAYLHTKDNCGAPLAEMRSRAVR